MDIRYQVFVSSTFSDLEDERADVIRTLLNMDCIPAGMELFPAADEEQFEYIKRVIDDCDYYLLIIGGRYGSTSTEGISYTELEYRYAVDKGIKVIALLHKDPQIIPVGKSEIDKELIEKLNAFRNEVAQNRLVKYWERREELPGLVALNLPAAIKMFPATGWVRADKVSSEQAQGRLLELEQENLNLRSKLLQIDPEAKTGTELLAKDDDLFEVHYSYELTYSNNSTKTTVSEATSLTWNEIMSALAPWLIQSGNNLSLRNSLSSYIFSKVIDKIKNEHGSDVTTPKVMVEENSVGTILIQLRALGYITYDGSRWRLTNIGDKKIMDTSAVKAKPSKG